MQQKLVLEGNLGEVGDLSLSIASNEASTNN